MLFLSLDVSKVNGRTSVECPECKRKISSKYLKKHLGHHQWPQEKILEFLGAAYKRKKKTQAHQCPRCHKIVSLLLFISLSTILFAQPV